MDRLSSRLDASLLRHDAYVLRGLQAAIECERDRFVRTHPERFVVLDMGAGQRPYLPLFATCASRYVACDLAGNQEEVTVVPGHPVALPDGTADLVVSFQVLEHVWDLDWYLGECRRLLASGGRLMLSTHGVWLHHPHPTDFRRWTREGLCAELVSRGFQIESMQAIGGPLAWTTLFRLIGYNTVLSRLGWIGKLLSWGLNPLMYARMCLEDRFTPWAVKENNAAVYLLVAKVA